MQLIPMASLDIVSQTAFTKECLRLQGLSSGLHDAAQELGVSDAKLKAACGNAWPVNLVAKLIQNMGRAMKWEM